MFGVNINIKEISFETQEDKDIVTDYVENKICITKLARKYHHNSRSITATLDKYNINHSRGQLITGTNNIACQRVFSQEEKDLIYNIYTNGGTTKDCIDAVHCNQDALKRVLKELGIYKSHKEVMKTLPQNQRKYEVNEDFFFKQSSNFAYFLGFVAADGSISKDRNAISIGLSAIDREQLEKFKETIGGRNIEEYTTNKGFDTIKWSFTSEKVKAELARYSIVPCKTFILKPPYLLDRKFWIDYIRGYFDGDGSVNYLTSNKALRWQVCSATPEVLQWMIDFLYEEYNIPKVNIMSQDRTNGKLYYFQYSTNATKSIYNILYTKDSWYLKRKKDKYEEILKKI
jgi:hypothetical protein